jgi:hypothetical protein
LAIPSLGVRGVLGIRKKQEISDATRERLKAFAFERKPRNNASPAQNIGQTVSPPPDVPSEQTPILEPELVK